MAILAVSFVLLGAQRAHAARASITYVHGHHLFSISISAHPEWRLKRAEWTFRSVSAVPPLHVVAMSGGTLPPHWDLQRVPGWSAAAIGTTLAREVARKLDREPGAVTIGRGEDGRVSFSGSGLTGRRVDVAIAAELTITALEAGATHVVLPVVTEQPAVTVADPTLSAMGIREVVAIGESDFTGSPENRRHNILVGIRRFHGHLIPQGAVFSFNEVLGSVSERTGYRKELVIQGEETLPDYGGGLCQVSSTAYRGLWEYGLPILQRRNHSYAVGYYRPQGTDATIYPPNVDVKARNDTPGSLLIQSFTDRQSRAYFVYYGTRDARKTEVVGPYIWNHVPAPPEEKLVYTTDIPAGEKRKAGERHDGMKAVWYRIVKTPETPETVERFSSAYEARPLYYQVGVAPGDIRAATGGTFRLEPNSSPSMR